MRHTIRRARPPLLSAVSWKKFDIAHGALGFETHQRLQLLDRNVKKI